MPAQSSARRLCSPPAAEPVLLELTLTLTPTRAHPPTQQTHPHMPTHQHTPTHQHAPHRSARTSAGPLCSPSCSKTSPSRSSLRLCRVPASSLSSRMRNLPCPCTFLAIFLTFLAPYLDLRFSFPLSQYSSLLSPIPLVSCLPSFFFPSVPIESLLFPQCSPLPFCFQD